MPEAIVTELIARLEQELEGLQALLMENLDFAEVERTLTESVNALLASLLAEVLVPVLTEAGLLEKLKRLGGRLGMRFKEYRRVRVRVGTGAVLEVESPYFVKASPKRGRRKRGPNGRGAHLGLGALGFIGRCSQGLISDVVQCVLLCPSLEVARQVLAQRGIELDVKTLSRLCRQLGEQGLAERTHVAFCGSERLSGYTVVIGIDGGRLRERRRKRGRKKAGQKRAGYHSDWKEPKLFTVYVVDAEGQMVKELAPLYDATLGDHEQLFALLERYLEGLDLTQADRVVFCGDGGPWIWTGVQALCERLGLEQRRVYQVLDYPHALQNLHEILDLVPVRLKAKFKLEKSWKELLWKGDSQGLYHAIQQVLTGKKKDRALKKWQRYFARHAQRMRYAYFRDQHLPCGSGCVESAIRRVINLRLKAPGTFWTRQMAECFLFLRAQLLSGRWEIVLENITRKIARMIEDQLVIEIPENLDEIPMAA